MGAYVGLGTLEVKEKVQIHGREAFHVIAVAKTNEIQNITFEVNGTDLSVTKSGSSSTAGADEEISVSLSGTDQFVIPKGTAVNMVIKADISAGAAEGGTFKMDITSTNANVVTASGVTSGNDIAVAEGTAAANNMTVGAAGGMVEVSLDSSSPDAALFAGGTTVDLAKFKFYATSTEDIELDYLYLTQTIVATESSSYLDYDEIWFVDETGTEITGTRMTPTSTMPYVNFSDDAFIVNYSDTNGEVLTLKAKLATIGTGYNGTSDHAVGYKIAAVADVAAKGNMTGTGSTEILGSAVPTGNTNYVYKAYPLFTRVNMTTALSNGTKDLYKWTVTAVNNDIGLYKFTFDVATTGCVVANYYVYDITGAEVVLDASATQASAGESTTAVMVSTIGTAWDGVYATPDEATVAAGTTRTFVLRGDLTGVAAGDSVSVRMGGDAGHVAGTDTLMHTANEAAADAYGDFIWSDKSVGSHTDTTDDWTNGFLVSGLPSSSTTAQVTAL